MKILDWNFGIGAAIGFLLTVFFCFKSGWVCNDQWKAIKQAIEGSLQPSGLGQYQTCLARNQSAISTETTRFS
ncbi:phytosulfokine receptor 1-like [Gossypium australe]|uniref:Phytosulfokine receptor 1-like n=1 Tax=Gossypium australe TaxID=47621 RepID=A0A5B6WL31_9ROSI|nr:phytosulfokine receptor 1-like [Gossypium australe]